MQDTIEQILSTIEVDAPKLGPALIVGYGGTGREVVSTVETLLHALGIDPVNGPVRCIVVDIPPAEVKSTFVTCEGAPIGPIARAVNNGSALGAINADPTEFAWLQGHKHRGPDLLTDGAGQVLEHGRFGFMYNLDPFISSVQGHLHELLREKEVEQGLTIIHASSLCGGMGASCMIDGAYIVQELLGYMNYQVLLRSRTYGIFAGPHAFMQTATGANLFRNTARTAKVLQALVAGELTGEVVYSQKQQPVISQVNGQLPLRTVFFIDHSRGGKATIGNQTAVQVTAGTLALLLSQQQVNKALREALRNVEDAPDWSPITRIGIQSTVVPQRVINETLTLRLAVELLGRNDSEQLDLETWLEALGGRSILVCPDVVPHQQLANFRLLKEAVLRQIDKRQLPDHVTVVLHGKDGSSGAMKRLEDESVASLNQAIQQLERLSRVLQQSIESASSPWELREWRSLLDELIGLVHECQEKERKHYRGIMDERTARDRDVPEGSNRAREAYLDLVRASHAILGDTIKATRKYLREKQTLLEDRVVDIANAHWMRSLAALLENLEDIRKDLETAIAQMDADAQRLKGMLQKRLTLISALGSASPLVDVFGANGEFDKLFAEQRRHLLEHAGANLGGFSAETVLVQAINTVNAIPAALSGNLDGNRPDPLWVLAPGVRDHDVVKVNMRVMPHGMTHDDGTTDVVGHRALLGQLVLEFNRGVGDFSGIPQAIRRLGENDDHPFVKHVKMNGGAS